MQVRNKVRVGLTANATSPGQPVPLREELRHLCIQAGFLLPPPATSPSLCLSRTGGTCWVAETQHPPCWLGALFEIRGCFVGPVCPLRGSCWLCSQGHHVSPSCLVQNFPHNGSQHAGFQMPTNPVSHPQPLGKGMAWSQRPGQGWGGQTADPSGESLWLRQEPGAARPGSLTPAVSNRTHLRPRALPTLVQLLLRCV